MHWIWAKVARPLSILIEPVRRKCSDYWRGPQLKSDIVFLCLFALIVLLINASVAANVCVPTGSMRDTIGEGERFLVRKLGYGLQNPLFPRRKITLDNKELLRWKSLARGDIVMFVPPRTTGVDDKYVKRLIALPGETVEVRPGVGVYVDGQLLAEPYVRELPRYWMPPQVVPEGMAFVLGDNRNNSYDSHAWGFLPLESIQGVMAFRYWPISRAGFLGPGARQKNHILCLVLACVVSGWLGRRVLKRKGKAAGV